MLKHNLALGTALAPSGRSGGGQTSVEDSRHLTQGPQSNVTGSSLFLLASVVAEQSLNMLTQIISVA